MDCIRLYNSKLVKRYYQDLICQNQKRNIRV